MTACVFSVNAAYRTIGLERRVQVVLTSLRSLFAENPVQNTESDAGAEIRDPHLRAIPQMVGRSNCLCLCFRVGSWGCFEALHKRLQLCVVRFRFRRARSNCLERHRMELGASSLGFILMRWTDSASSSETALPLRKYLPADAFVP